MLSIQECVNKTEKQRKKVEDFMDSKGYFDPQECNMYEGLKRSIQRELSETLRKLTLKELLFGPGTLSTGTLGAAGVHYLVPTWLSQKLYAASALQDIVPLISADVFEPRGGDCTVPVGMVNAHVVGEGEIPTDAYTGTGATIKLQKIVVPTICTNEMIEDNQFGLVEWHIKQSGEAMGRAASNNALEVLKTATDGYGTYTAVAGGAGTTGFANFISAVQAVSEWEMNPNTMVITTQAWTDTVQMAEFAGGAAGDFGLAYMTMKPPATGFDLNFYGCDTVFSNLRMLHAAADAEGAAFTKCVTIVFDRNVALVTARKNWLRVENYSFPVKDLAGAVISGRQDSITAVDCAIAVITET